MTEREALNNLALPQLFTKSRGYIENNQQIQINTTMNEQDEVIQTEEGRIYSQQDQNRNFSQYEQQQNVSQYNKQIYNLQISEDCKFENNNLQASIQNEIKYSKEKSSLFNDNNISSRRQINTFRQISQFQKQEKDVKNIPFVSNQFQSQKNIVNNPIQNQQINLTFSEQLYHPQQIQSKSYEQREPVQIKNQQNKVHEQLKKKLNNIEYYTKKLKTIQDINIFKKFTSINFGYWFSIQKRLKCLKKKNDEQDKKILSLQQKTFIEQQVLKSMNIIELLKDIIFIKKSIMVLLSKDQLAAMKLVGYSENYIQDHYLKNDIKNKDKSSTYFENQLDILDSTELSCKYVKKFIDKCSNSKLLDKIDKRILSSINKNQVKQ
ncbi:hypothetical protein ABPG73_018924 [Tetrahymena malaccensis]